LIYYFSRHNSAFIILYLVGAAEPPAEPDYPIQDMMPPADPGDGGGDSDSGDEDGDYGEEEEESDDGESELVVLDPDHVSMHSSYLMKFDETFRACGLFFACLAIFSNLIICFLAHLELLILSGRSFVETVNLRNRTFGLFQNSFKSFSKFLSYGCH
jgi:hypothetical protein